MLIITIFETKNKDGSDYLYYKAIVNRFYHERGTGIKIEKIFFKWKG